jgi:hypothetical protein
LLQSAPVSFDTTERHEELSWSGRLPTPKVRFDELLDKALHEGPQRIKIDKGVVVFISQEELDLDLIEGRSEDFVQHLLSIPKGDIEFPQDKSPMQRLEEW